MTGKDRILTALDHKLPDRVPLISGQTNATGIKMKSYRALKKLLGERSGARSCAGATGVAEGER